MISPTPVPTKDHEGLVRPYGEAADYIFAAHGPVRCFEETVEGNATVLRSS